uniref:Uncharacterized protein n=1 Tax=Manihot esculenta TaxID=3983 RepID=A0A2C9V3W6_MANES
MEENRSLLATQRMRYNSSTSHSCLWRSYESPRALSIRPIKTKKEPRFTTLNLYKQNKNTNPRKRKKKKKKERQNSRNPLS